MEKLIISQEFKNSIQKLNNGEINNLEDAQKCLFYIQNYPKNRLKYLKRNLDLKYDDSLKEGETLGLVDCILICFSIIFVIFDLIFCHNLLNVGGLFAALFSAIPIVTQLSHYLKAKKILKEEEKQLIIYINSMQGESSQKSVANTHDMVESKSNVDKYIKDIQDLMLKITKVKYPNYLDDLNALLSLGKEYLQRKEKIKSTNETLALDGNLLKKYNLIANKVNDEISVFLDKKINEQALNETLEKLKAEGITLKADSSAIPSPDLNPTLKL